VENLAASRPAIFALFPGLDEFIPLKIKDFYVSVNWHIFRNARGRKEPG
jgi:hypothetical protein